MRTENRKEKRINGWKQTRRNAQRARSPQAADRCTHENLLSVSTEGEEAVCLPPPCLGKAVNRFL